MHFMRIIIFVTLACLIVGCHSYLPFERKLKVQQGNIITPEMAAQIKTGMSKTQVSYLMGTALLEDTFTSSQWDYIYSYQLGDDPMDLRRVSIFFDKQDKVSHIEKYNITEKKQAVPAAYTAKTFKATDKDESMTTKRGETRSEPSASGKPQIRGSEEPY
jgi:outer membrane protein assembly factor BamE